MGAIFAVAGNPVLHSRSPEIFNAAFRALSIDATYTRIAAETAAEVMETARKVGLAGFNVTSPFKIGIIPYLDEVDDDARRLASVNTVVHENGRFKGYNTDHTGVCDALARNGVPLRGQRAVVLGASGAGKAAVYALNASGAKVTLINRSFDRARVTAGLMGCAAVSMDDIDESVRNADILVSCIPSAGRFVSPSALSKSLTVLDANYSLETALTADARAMGSRIIDAREWLLFQALPAFSIFTGAKAPLDVMRSALYRTQGARKENVGLIGFMGVGKSRAAESIAARLNMIAVDTDESIEEQTGLPIAEFFKRHKEDAFRELEEIEVMRAAGLSNAVISFGGGVVTREGNVKAIKDRCVSVWLWASPETIMERIGSDGARPLLSGADKPARVDALLRERLPLYARASDLIIDTDNLGPREITERICHEIHKPL